MFGTPGNRPESYWQPWLGDHVGVAARDLADLTPGQMLASYEYVANAQKAGG